MATRPDPHITLYLFDLQNARSPVWSGRGMGCFISFFIPPRVFLLDGCWCWVARKKKVWVDNGLDFLDHYFALVYRPVCISIPGRRLVRSISYGRINAYTAIFGHIPYCSSIFVASKETGHVKKSFYGASMSEMYLASNLYDPEKVDRKPSRDGYGDGLIVAGTNDKNVVVLCADLTESTRSEAFAKQWPDRFIEIGVAEQNMAGIAAGMALNGKVPFISSYATFSPGRSWDQVRVSICYTKANVKIAGHHTGISVGPDGATHQALEDLAIMRVLPNMTVIYPCDAVQAKKATISAAVHDGPVYLRFMREKTPVVTTERTPFAIGKSYVYKEGRDVTVVAAGSLVYEALLAARSLEKEISVEVVNTITIKPLDRETIIASVKKTGAVVTAEEHQISGGLGSAVAELVGEAHPVPLARVGMLDTFGESGAPDELMDKYGMREKDIVKAIESVVKRKKS